MKIGMVGKGNVGTALAAGLRRVARLIPSITVKIAVTKFWTSSSVGFINHSIIYLLALSKYIWNEKYKKTTHRFRQAVFFTE